ncbi:AraC family transcriptional regulator [Clostridium gasigenes]|uniref:AraC-type DNA-binding protein n=1 Tax=Clostridium gasigenes TaxID=94869 RepID=A0A1H0VXI0_9CLOT|nr:AraC family transcriptional regulator [Clostridium gasigenes]SDP82905.1 AraC-type DNA-binding protein [Clostridium gasigenes]
MQVAKIEVDDNLQETTKHGSYDLPIAIYTDNFNLFEDGHIRLHWHNELQFSYSLCEKVCFFIEGQKIILEPGEGIMINSNVLHQIKPYNNNNCMMFSIVFDPILIGGTQQSRIEKKYINPILKSSNLRFIYLKPDIQWQKNILKYLKEIFILSNQKAYGYELEMRNCLSSLWLNLLREVKEEVKDSVSVVSHDEERVKSALQYIHKYYAENILLDNIAMSVNISKSECCRSFKRILKVTPFEYLMEYRISKASRELLKSKESISNIAFDVGFNGTSYFGKIFKKYMNCTPSEYRIKYKQYDIV